MNRQRKFILIAAAVGVISVFLPWTTISAGIFGYNASQSVNGFRGFGILVFLAFASAGVITFIGEQTKALEKSMWLTGMGTGVVALLFTIISLMRSPGGMGGGFGIVEASHGFGIWLALVASSAIVLCAWVLKNAADDLKSSFASFKASISIPSNLKPKADTNTSSHTNKIAELEKLIELKNKGNISEEEYQQLKSKLL